MPGSSLNDEREQTLNQMLAGMDGFEAPGGLEETPAWGETHA